MAHREYSYNGIKSVHFEPTTRCNLDCPMCPRTVHGGWVNPMLPITELDLAQVKQIFPQDFIRQIDKFYMCGNYGEPIVARDTLEIFQWLKSINSTIQLGLHTNGSARNTEWWRELALCFSGPNDHVIFGIDGLEDTNHLYRKGANWNKVMSNAQTYISSGGKNSCWTFIAFRHNEHQIEQAQRLSTKLNFTKFITKKTSRFINPTTGEYITDYPVFDSQGETVYWLQQPDNQKLRNTSVQEIAQSTERAAFLNETQINCKIIREKSIFVSAEALVFPCCWTASIYNYPGGQKQQQLYKLLDGNYENLSLFKRSLKSIVDGKYFDRIFASWNMPAISQGKLLHCADNCSKVIDRFSDQFR